MINKTALAMLLGGLAVASASGAFAQSPAPAAPPAQDGKAMQPGMMMDGKGGMQGVMMNEEMTQKMSNMMDNCNKMMETTMQNKNTPSVSPAVPKQG